MKKYFTLFVAALFGLCAFAQASEYGPCPSKLNFALLNGDNPSQVEIELQLVNSSLNLNGFLIRVEKAEGSESVQWKKVNSNYFTAVGYANVILARWEGVTDEEREAALSSMCDIYNSINQDKQTIIELLSTTVCRSFPVLEEPTGIGKFYLDMSACEDGIYTLVAHDTPETLSFIYTVAEPLSSWTADEPLEIDLVKENGVVQVLTPFVPDPLPEYSDFYVVGTFNGWNQEEEGGRIELVENEEGTQYTGEVELEDGAEFKIITPVEDGWKWFGGVDENQVGYFEINDNLLNQQIELVNGANFKVVGDGKYTITVMKPTSADDRGLTEPLVMTVAKEATGVSTIAADKVDNRIFDIQGRELQSVPEHGIYIQNGKKYVK